MYKRQNLLIKIPEDILNDEDLTPQLVSPDKPEEVKIEQEVDQMLKQKDGKDKDTALLRKKAPETPQDPVAEASPAPAKKTILNSLSSIFSSDNKTKGQKAQISSQDEEETPGSNVRKRLTKVRRPGRIMPTEMRLSFQPNRAEISGQTLRWIQAFAAKAATNPSMFIEIRIDGTSAMELQQRRLNLLHNILTNKGVEYSKINTVFTNREPNSFIIRTLSFNNTHGGGNENLNNGSYYQQW